MLKNVEKMKATINKKTPEEMLSWAIETFTAEKIALASSMGAEDQVLTDMLCKQKAFGGSTKCTCIFTLDTGRLPQETYDVIAETNKKYGIRIEMLFPNTEDIQKMETSKGPNLFYESIENRKECCRMRKIVPLQKKLKTLEVWICGLRKDQAVTRASVEKFEWDKDNGIIKLNPLAEWTTAQVWDYLKTNKVPYNKLHDNGYPSIGCAPCTRAVQAGEYIRAGRWWWESPESKECGLHVKDGKLVKK